MPEEGGHATDPAPSKQQGGQAGVEHDHDHRGQEHGHRQHELQAEDDLVANQLEAVPANSQFLSLDLHFEPLRPASFFGALAPFGGLKPRRQIYLLGLLVNPREKQFSVLMRTLLIPPCLRSKSCDLDEIAGCGSIPCAVIPCSSGTGP